MNDLFVAEYNDIIGQVISLASVLIDPETAYLTSAEIIEFTDKLATHERTQEKAREVMKLTLLEIARRM